MANGCFFPWLKSRLLIFYLGQLLGTQHERKVGLNPSLIKVLKRLVKALVSIDIGIRDSRGREGEFNLSIVKLLV